MTPCSKAELSATKTSLGTNSLTTSSGATSCPAWHNHATRPVCIVQSPALQLVKLFIKKAVGVVQQRQQPGRIPHTLPRLAGHQYTALQPLTCITIHRLVVHMLASQHEQQVAVHMATCMLHAAADTESLLEAVYGMPKGSKGCQSKGRTLSYCCSHAKDVNGPRAWGTESSPEHHCCILQMSKQLCCLLCYNQQCSGF